MSLKTEEKVNEETSGTEERNEELRQGLSGKGKGVAEVFGKWQLKGGTRTEEAAAARAWMTGWVTEELRPESQPGDPTRNHSRDWKGGFLKNGTTVSHMGTEEQDPRAGKGGPGPLQEGGSRCVHGRQEQHQHLAEEQGAGEGRRSGTALGW